jgi:hypothetical protein
VEPTQPALLAADEVVLPAVVVEAPVAATNIIEEIPAV